jgi:von Willebrand factor type A domain
MFVGMPHSSIRLPLTIKFGDTWNPDDQSAKEAICFSRQLDLWFVEKRANDSDFWKVRLNSIEPPLNSMFFASHHGPFRIYPARVISDTCGVYDARIRPWYMAGSSGAKNIVLLLDVSGAMNAPLELLKLASQRVVNATTINDHITVISFNSTAKAYTTNDGYMLKATEENKLFLNDAIANLSTGGGTNYSGAFETAFKVLDESIANEAVPWCNTAVIFLTDDGAGNQLLGENLTKVKSLVAERMKNVSDAINRTAILFTYSLSSSNDNAFDANVFPAELACEVEYGVWSHVSNDNDLMVDFLSNYYRLFALGLGSQDRNYVAWVHPYKFATPANTWGTTVSRAVFDRSSDPPIFLGVVGIDFDLRALNVALSSGSTNIAKETISREVNRQIGILANNISCPEVTACELDAYQASTHSYHQQNDDVSNNNQSTCRRGCTDQASARVLETVCDGGFYPSDLWKNTDFYNKDVTYTDRFCCKNNSTAGVATPGEENVCLAADAAVPTSSPAGALESTSRLTGGAIAGITVSLVAVATGLLLYVWRRGVFAHDQNGGDSSSPITTIPPPPATNPSYAMWETTAPAAP